MTLRTLNYGNYGIFLIMGNAGFCPSAVSQVGLEDPPDQHQASSKSCSLTMIARTKQVYCKQGIAMVQISISEFQGVELLRLCECELLLTSQLAI